MKLAADFRRIARDILKGNWTIAVLVGLVASLLGAIEGMGPEVKFEYDGSGAHVNFAFAGQNIYSTGGTLNSDIAALLVSGISIIMLASLIMGILYFILGSIIEVGYARFNLNLADREEAGFGDLFTYFSYWKTTTAARFLKGLYVLLWSLLFIIPGIIASYSYTMTGYILAERPELTAGEAIDMSKQMMRGNRWRLFCLQFSFIGWSILCSFTLGIGNLWLTPYKQAAKAAFYREISGTGRRTQEYDWEGYAESFYE